MGGDANVVLLRRHVRSCEGFRMPAHDDVATHTGAGVRKPPKEEIAGRRTWEVRPTFARFLGLFDFRLLQQYRHETDMPAALRDVRSQGQSGKHLLALSFSGF